ncbi:hypothetical protein ACFE04_014107 [Oxalis oulophora]
MKGEYVEPKNENMFSKLHPHHNHQQQQHHHQQQQHNPFSHHFQLEADVTTTVTPPPQQLKPIPFSPTGSAHDEPSIEISRRPRGRPPGSKNKPRPPIFITREPEPVMSPYILEVPGGTDIVEIISRFCRRKNLGLCVLSASGTVANVTLRQPSTTTASTITFHGRFDLLSISATFLPQTSSYQVPNVFSISLATPQGQIMGGVVAGALIAAGTVFVVAASFNNPTYHRLTGEEEVRNSVSGGGEGQSPPGSIGGGGSSIGGGGEGGQAESCGMYSSHNGGGGGSDVLWAPTARQPQQQQPPPY